MIPGSSGELGEELPNPLQVCTRFDVQRVLGVRMFEHHVDKRATLELGAAEPGVEHVEDGQQLLARIRAPPLDLTLKPPPGPDLVPTLRERQHEVLLGGEVAIHRLPGYARSLDDRVDPDRLDAPTREQLVGRFEQSLARLTAAPFALTQKR